MMRICICYMIKEKDVKNTSNVIVKLTHLPDAEKTIQTI